MATIRQKAATQYWFAVLNIEGKRIYRSTKIPVKGGEYNGEKLTPSRAKAKALIIAEMMENSMNVGTLVAAKKCQEEVERFVNPFKKTNVSNREWCKKIVKRAMLTNAEKTWKSYESTLNIWLNWLKDKADKSVSSITNEVAFGFISSCLEVRRAGTVTRFVKILKLTYSRAQKEELISSNPFDGITIPRRKREEDKMIRSAFTLPELKKLLATLEGEWRSAVFISLCLGGQRLGDVVLLRWDNIDGDIIRFLTQKTSRQVIIPILPALKHHLDDLPRANEYILPDLAERYLKNRNLSGEFTQILRCIGFDLEQPSYKRREAREDEDSLKKNMSRLSFHSLRGTAVTMLHEAGVPAAVVQEIVGHSSEAVHRQYIKIGLSSINSALKTMPIEQILPPQ